jgi:hypothetical protein
LITVDNFLIGVIDDRISEQVFNQQRVGISRRGSFNQQVVHGNSFATKRRRFRGQWDEKKKFYILPTNTRNGKDKSFLPA